MAGLLAIAPLVPFVLGARPPKWNPIIDHPPAQVARGKAGVVVSAHPLASAAGIELLQKGGNAIDAAVATAFALGVVEQYRSGIGGGGFLLYYEAKSKKLYGLDFRETAPSRASHDMYIVGGKFEAHKASDGALSVAVPGMVPGLEEAEARFGKKKLKDALEPAIEIAENGFLVYPALAEEIMRHLPDIKKNAACAKLFLHEDGEPYALGERMTPKDLARTLKDLAKDGSKLFKEGRIAQAIVKESARLGGILGLDDLKAVKLRVREPISTDYRGYTIWTMPPPSSGFVMLEILKMHEIDLMKRQVTGNRISADDVHFLAEIERRAFSDRAKFGGDPAFTDVPGVKLLSPDYLASRYGSIDPVKATPTKDVKDASFDDGLTKHTTHLTVIDREGNVAALTNTVNNYFGSGVVVPDTGILLNDEMDDFAGAPNAPNIYGAIGGEANSIQPGKVPLSSMTPSIVMKDGKVVLATGAPGGTTIITTVVQVILNVIDRQMDVAHAVAEPRFHMQGTPDHLMVEKTTFTPEIRAELEKRGYHLSKERVKWGNATAIEVYSDGTRYGAADPRGDGAGDAE